MRRLLTLIVSGLFLIVGTATGKSLNNENSDIKFMQGSEDELVLMHANDLYGDQQVMDSHASHRSHASHASHSSHSSHRSGM